MGAENINDTETRCTAPPWMQEFRQELATAREFVNGPAAPVDMLTEENFPTIATHSPATLALLKQIAEVNLNSDRLRVERFEEIEAWNWPNDDDKSFLFAAAGIGKLEEAMDVLKNEVNDRVKSGLRRAGISGQVGLPIGKGKDTKLFEG